MTQALLNSEKSLSYLTLIMKTMLVSIVIRNPGVTDDMYHG